MTHFRHISAKIVNSHLRLIQLSVLELDVELEHGISDLQTNNSSSHLSFLLDKNNSH